MTTLADVRRQVARKLRDFKRITATVDTTTSTFRDSRRLLEINGAYSGSWIRILSATAPANIGHTARVLGSTQSSAELTFTPAAPEIVLLGDVAELYNLFGRGYEPADYDEMIASLVVESFPSWLDYKTDDTFGVFNQGEPTLLIPEGFTHVYELQMQQSATVDTWIPIPPSFYYVDPARGAITVVPHGGEVLHGRSIRLNGYQKPTEPVDDDDLVTVPRSWLIPAVAAQLAARRTGNREWQEWAVEWGREAEANKYELQRSRMNNCVRVRD